MFKQILTIAISILFVGSLLYSFNSQDNTWSVGTEANGIELNSSSELVPGTDDDISLGNSSLEFEDLYIDGTAKIDVLTVDETSTLTGAVTVTSGFSADSLKFVAIIDSTTLSTSAWVLGIDQSKSGDYVLYISTAVGGEWNIVGTQAD